MKITIAICDDDDIFVEKFHNTIRNLLRNSVHLFTIYNFTSGLELINVIKNKIIPDLDIVFLDIELTQDNILGTEVGINLKSIKPDILIIYTSFYNQYDRNIIRAEPFDFLKKPVQYSELTKTVHKALSRIQYLKQDNLFAYKSKGITFQVNIKDILYFESKHRKINIYLKDGTIQEFYEKLDNVEEVINNMCDYFLRPSKSYLVNFYYMSRVSNTSLLIYDVKINIGQKYRDTFLKKMRPLISH